MRERERWQKEDARRRVRGGGGGGGRWTKMQGREVGCCNENEITGTTRCRDGDKDRAEVRERDAHKKRRKEGEEGTSSCCCVEETALFTARSHGTQKASQ